MTPFEIKKYFGIDIATRKRDRLFVYLRAIYANENYKNMTAVEIAKNINIDRTNVFHLLKSYDKYNSDIYFKLILDCYHRKDKSLLQKSNEFLGLKAKEVNDYNASRIKIKRLSKPNIVTIRKNKTDEVKFKKPSIFVVAENLRNKKTYLKDKVYSKWTSEDFKLYEQIKKS